jgi:hypothetical protein
VDVARVEGGLLHFERIGVSFQLMKHAHVHIVPAQGWWWHLSIQWDAMCM